LLCYECGELVAYKDGNGIAALEAHGGTPAALNTLLTNAHVPLSFVYNPETKDLPYSEKSIPATMFPNAPAKAASAQCFSFVSAETPIATVVQKCGKPDRETGRQGLHNFVWKLQDKSIVIVSTPYLDRIYNAAYIDAAGKTFPLLHAKDGLNR
jgi:hypothetical protein